ncbi:NAD-dependent epimerase/dehydratase family protein [Capnocytophaga catalasegens]|uniref:NDP-sugar dehydratase or epimerase n=1 Tax=Capnocytophaga catalasegens TaxID=1004260 RepID=A0AAV5APJ0_9FLAO|nr:NAD-dependent epimerase/dehydratase family protein [Capnocytophaga catalasegens]GIZ14880.1 NDP-sugar dehydratase or epimerase [Capnocytophaga catalasegens]GJM49258.1 NDP-sugar dehydratase or epimerase [Capnocytophaga catalasegens]GJM52409.1 NDP-sugar dehydratase or epimerase [Capnocytophaga catalasegens]
MKRILVTGGAGFIGSNLCEYFVQNTDYEVFSLDNYFTGSKENHVPGVTYMEGNTTEIAQLIDFVPDIVYHLGEYSRVEQSFEDMDKVWKFNKDGIFAVLEFCRYRGSKIVYAGSSTKFGDGGIGRNQSPYAWSKASNTELVVNYGNWYNIPYAVVYFYNVYGKREISQGKYATLIALFAEKIRRGEPLPVVSPGMQKRNFTHVDDIISGLVLVGEKGLGDEFGIGSHQAYTILEIAQLFGGEIVMLPERRGNRMSAEVITDKTEALGWKNEKNIKDYIREICKQLGK